MAESGEVGATIRLSRGFRNVRTADGSELSRDDFDVCHRVSKIAVLREDDSSFEI